MDPELEEPACELCGTVRISNAIVGSRPANHYHDGPSPASIEETVVCSDCADELDDYLRTRLETADAEETAAESSPFTDADVDALLERLAANDRLVLDPGYGYGIRYVDGEWQQAWVAGPARPTIDVLDRTDVERVVRDSRRLTLKRLDRAAWAQYDEFDR